MKQIASLQVMRGLAALAVVFYHTYIILRQPEYSGHEIFPALAKHGLLGVNFFFVLSGFIILMAHSRDLGQPKQIPRYLYRRVVRLYPAYWVFLTSYIVASGLGLGYPDFSWDLVNLASSYLLIDLSPVVSLPLKVAWTLLYEVRFYLLFAVLLYSVRLGVLVFGLWMLAVIVSFFLGVKDSWNLLSPWNIYFVFGMGVFVVLERIDARAGVGVLATGLIMVGIYAANFNLSMGELKSEYEYVLFWLAPAFSLIILGTVLVERQFDLNMPRLLMFLGDASYSIYLVHSAVISVLALIASKFGLVNEVSPYLLFALIFIAASISGVIAHMVVERPLLALFRGRSRVVAGSEITAAAG